MMACGLFKPRSDPRLMRSEAAGHLFWWVFDYEWPGIVTHNKNPTQQQRDTLANSIQAYAWWLALGWPEKGSS